MNATILISNPFLFFPSQFVRMVRIMTQQSAAMSSGWTLTEAKGPASWLPIINQFYGQLIFIALAFIALALGIWRGANKTLHPLIAAWAIPFGLYMLFAIAIKSTHFFLPILLPVYGSLVVLLEFPPFVSEKPRPFIPWLWGGLVIALITYQFVVYINQDIALYRNVLGREDTEQSLVFYHIIERNYLPLIKSAEPLTVFRDVRMYFPDTPKWVIRSYWKSNYTIIDEVHPDLIVLWSQRIRDYTQQGALGSAVDLVSFQDMYQFYIDADKGQLRGYHLIYRNEEGLFFISDALYQQFFK
ncbi:MAG: hypothetical protein M1485_01015 [Chloroflexi bacterium]|nr:hypothetical protein [Chloroflexota bacterium]